MDGKGMFKDLKRLTGRWMENKNQCYTGPRIERNVCNLVVY